MEAAMGKEGVDLEDEYFHREEQEQLAKLRAVEAARKAEADRVALQALHHLHCGKCGNRMDTQIFKGVEIEVCPACGAVLLDAGELEKVAGPDQSGIITTIGDLFNFSKKKK